MDIHIMLEMGLDLTGGYSRAKHLPILFDYIVRASA